MPEPVQETHKTDELNPDHAETPSLPTGRQTSEWAIIIQGIIITTLCSSRAEIHTQNIMGTEE